MIKQFKYSNWKDNTPKNIIEFCFSPCSNGLRVLNFICQKIFGINKKVKLMVHYTSIASGKITIGKDVARYIASSPGCYYQGINGIEIGDYTMIAPGVKIISANHDMNDYKQHVRTRSIKIGTRCWLGANAIILPGVHLGDNVIVGAGSIVTKSFNSNVIIAGNPAQIIRTIKNNSAKLQTPEK